MSRQPKCPDLLLEVTQERAVTQFVVKQGEATLEVRFVSPAFGLLQPVHEGLHQNMLGQLATHGLRLSDIRFESAPVTLAEVHSSYSINALSVLVRVWLDRLEISFLDLARVTQEQRCATSGVSVESRATRGSATRTRASAQRCGSHPSESRQFRSRSSCQNPQSPPHISLLTGAIGNLTPRLQGRPLTGVPCKRLIMIEASPLDIPQWYAGSGTNQG
jgi:hypothetical protein